MANENALGGAEPAGDRRDAVAFARHLAFGVAAWGNDLSEVARELSAATGDARRILLLGAAAECDEFASIAREVSARLRGLADGR